MLLRIFSSFNLIFILFFIFANIVVFKFHDMSKLKAFCGLLMTLFFGFYFMLTVLVTAYYIFKDFKAAILLLFVFLSLLIGRKVQYETLLPYSIFQFVVLSGSFFFSLKFL